MVALTFDDGWSTPRCQKILDILVAQNVPATFFPNALYVRKSPAFWRRVAELGFPIGNHTTNHRDLTELSSSAVFKEIDRDREIVEQITGAPMIRVMRPPFGSYNKRTLKQSTKAGFPTLLLWDVTSLDTSRRASDRAMIRPPAAAGTARWWCSIAGRRQRRESCPRSSRPTENAGSSS